MPVIPIDREIAGNINPFIGVFTEDTLLQVHNALSVLGDLFVEAKEIHTPGHLTYLLLPILAALKYEAQRPHCAAQLRAML